MDLNLIISILLTYLISTCLSIPQKAVLFANRYYKGQSLTVEFDRCTILPTRFQYRVSSVDPRGDCVILWSQSCCQGQKLELNSSAIPSYRDFSEVDFNDLAVSISPCGKYPVNTPDHLKQKLGGQELVVTKQFANPKTAVSVYYDEYIPPEFSWPGKFISDVWKYVRRTYGIDSKGEDGTLLAILHGKQPIWESSVQTHYDEAGECRNIIEVSATSHTSEWFLKNGPILDNITSEVASLVLSLYRGGHSYPVYGDYEEEELKKIMVYDMFRGLGLKREEFRFYDKAESSTSNHPRNGTHWFRDWYYPIYQDGGSAVLKKYLRANLKFFGREYHKNGFIPVNLGQFVHVWSSVSGVDLKPRAEILFGWSVKDEFQFVDAKNKLF